MPESRYFLADTVLTSLFAIRDRDCEAIFAAFDQIAERPRDVADAIGRDWDGRLVCVARFGRFEIGYVIAASTETVTFTLLRPSRS
jgi:hypothetical protein